MEKGLSSKSRFIDYLREGQGAGGILVLAFLFLPYCVDIGWYGDLTPSHFAQENSNDSKESDPTVEKAYLHFVLDHAPSIETGHACLRIVNSRYRCSDRVMLSPQYLPAFSHTSRPPPVL